MDEQVAKFNMVVLKAFADEKIKCTECWLSLTEQKHCKKRKQC